MKKNGITALTRTGFCDILMISLYLSVCGVVIMINFGGSEVDAGASFANMAATLVYLLAAAGLTLYAVHYGHRMPLIFIRVWLIAGMAMCLLSAVLTLAGAGVGGAFGVFMYIMVMLFCSPFYGLYLFGDSTVAVMSAGFVLSAAGCFLPLLFRYIAARTAARRALK